jgi:hypothetical protein
MMKKLFALMLGLGGLTSIQAKTPCLQESININKCGTTVVVADKSNMNPDMYANQIALSKTECGQMVATLDLLPTKCQAPMVTPVMMAAIPAPTCCF